MSELSDLGNDVKVESEVENPEKSDVDYGDGDGVNDFDETNNEMRQDSSDFNYQEGSDSDVPGDVENPDPDMSSEEKAEDIDTGIENDIPAETETAPATDAEINNPDPHDSLSSEERADAYVDEFEDDSDETGADETGSEEVQQTEEAEVSDAEESGEGNEATNQDETQTDSTDNVTDGSESDASSEYVENDVTADADVNSSVDDVEDQTGNTAADETEDNKSAEVKSESDDSAKEDVGDQAEDSDGSEVSESGQEDAAASEETGVEDESSEADGDSTGEQGNEEKNNQDSNEETASEKVDETDNSDGTAGTKTDEVIEDSTNNSDVKGDEAGESVDDSAVDGAEDGNTAETNSEDNAESVSGEDNDNVETSDDVESSETENATAETNDDAADESSSNDVSDESAGDDTDEAENAVETDAEGSENNNEGDNAEGFEVDGTDGEVTEDNAASDNNGENQSESSADATAENNSADETKNENSEKTSEDTTDQKETSDTDEASESDNNDEMDESGENESTEGVNDESGAEQNGETSSENNNAIDSENEGSSADVVDEGAEDDNSDNNKAKSESGLDTEESDNQSGVSDTNEESKNINETDDSNKNVEDNRAEIDAHNESDANQANDATDANQQASANDTSFDGTEANTSTTPIENNATGEVRSVETEKGQILENCSYHQGQNDVGALGTCGPTSIANSLNRVTGTNDYTENKVLHNALDNNLCHKSDNPYSCGGTTTRDVVCIIDNVKDPESNIHTEVYDYDKALDVDSLADRLDESGTVAMVGVDSATLWDQRGDVSNSGLFAGYSESPSDHWITVDSPVRDENGNVTGFNIVDSGGGVDFVDRDKFEKMYQGDDSHKVSDPTAIIVSNKGDNVNTISTSDNVARAANYKGSAEISSGNDPPEIKNSSRDINGIELSDAAKEVNARFSGENFRAEKSFEATLSESDKDKTIDANKKTTCGLNENLGGTLDNAKFASNVDAKDLKDIKELRTRVPEIDQDTVMQKVIPADSVGKYLDGSFTQVGGCVAKANDAAPYTTNGEAAYKNLRLDYPGTKYEGFQSGEDMYVIRYKYTDDYVPSNSDIPLQADNKPPCTGTGFLGSEEHLIPEYTHDYTDISDGAIYKIDKDGNEIMVAMWDPFENKFTDKITGE